VFQTHIVKAQSPRASGWSAHINANRPQTTFFAVIAWQIEHLNGSHKSPQLNCSLPEINVTPN
jgi:hypothetical protein